MWLKNVGVPIEVSSLISHTKLTNLAWALLQGLQGLFDALELEDLPYASVIVRSTLLKTMRKTMTSKFGYT